MHVFLLIWSVREFLTEPRLLATREWRVLPYSLDGGVPMGSRKSYPSLDQILQIS